jgi:hypothetical protein
MLDAFLTLPVVAACLLAVPQPAAPSLAPLSLKPAAFEARAGEQLSLRLEGTDANPLDWNAHPAAWFAVRAAGTQENTDAEPAAARGGAGGPIAIQLDHAGVTMIGAEFAPIDVRLTPAQLRAALEPLVTVEELDKTLADLPRDKPSRVRLVRGCKTLLHVAAADPAAHAVPDAQTSVSKFGHAAEIRTLIDPLNSLVGGDIMVRFHANYDKAPRARGFATNLDTGKTQEFVTDGSGIGYFHMHEPGRWQVHFTTVRLAPKGDGADVVIYSASVTFAATRVEAAK